MGEAGTESGDVDTNAGAGRKRRPELELSGSTKLAASAVIGEGTQKQWISAPSSQSGQASPADGGNASSMSKTSKEDEDASKERANNSVANFSSFSGFLGHAYFH